MTSLFSNLKNNINDMQDGGTIRALMHPASFAAIVALLVSVLLPLEVINNNRVVFAAYGMGDVFANAFTHFLIVFLIAFGLAWVLRQFATNFYATIIAAALFFITVTGLFLPLRSGLLDGIDEIKTSWLTLIPVLFVSVAGAVLAKRGTYALSVTFLGISFLTAIMSGAGLDVTKGETPATGVSRDANIFLISFDGMMSGSVHRVLENNPDYSDKMTGFVNYDNVTGVAPYTHQSLQITRTGQVFGAETTDAYTSATQASLITTKLKAEGFAIRTHGIFQEYETEGSVNIVSFKQDGRRGAARVAYIDATTAGYLRSALAFPNAVPSLLKALARRSANDTGPSQDFLKVIDTHPHPLANHKLGLFEFRSYVDNLAVTSDAPTANLFHFTFTHDPIMLSEDCEAGTYNAQEQRGIIDSEVSCALGEFVEFVEKLKALNVYDSSLIVFASDHGYECHLPSGRDAPAYRVSERWCLSRYMPLMMVKLPGAEGPFQRSEFRASLIDIAPTLCTIFLPEPECREYQGVDLGNITPASTQIPRPILVARSEQDIRNFSNFDVVDIGRDNSIEAYFGLPEASATPVLKETGPKVFYTKLTAADFKQQVGRKEGDVIIVESPADPQGYSSYGPYMSLPAGRYDVTLEYSSSLSPNKTAAVWDFASNIGAKVYHSEELKGTNSELKRIAAQFDLTEPVSDFEVRTLFKGSGMLKVSFVSITSASAE